MMNKEESLTNTNGLQSFIKMIALSFFIVQSLYKTHEVPYYNHLPCATIDKMMFQSLCTMIESQVSEVHRDKEDH